MKKFLIAFVSVFLVFGLNKAFSQNFYTGDGGKGQEYVIDKSVLIDGASDKRDASLPNTVKEDFKGAVGNYSAITIGDKARFGSLIQSAKEKEINENAYEEKKSKDTGNSVLGLINTDKQIIITVTRLKSEKYKIQATVEDGSTGAILFQVQIREEMSLDDAQKMGGAKLAWEFFKSKKVNVKLTVDGERDLLQVAFSDESEEAESLKRRLETYKKREQAYNEEISKLLSDSKNEQEISIKNALLQREKIQAEQLQERLRRLKSQQEQKFFREKEEKELDEQRKKERYEQEKLINEKTDEFSRSFRAADTAVKKIESIELGKRNLAAVWKDTLSDIAKQNADFDKELQKEIEAAAKNVKDNYKDFLDEKGYFVGDSMNIFLDEIDSFQKKNAKDKEAMQLAQMKTADALKNEISNRINDLEKTEYTANSATHGSGLFLEFEKYDIKNKVWNYSIRFSIGKEHWSYKGALTYKELTGNEPVVYTKEHKKEFDDYNSLVKLYEVLLNGEKQSVYAELKFKIRAKENSKYELEIQNLELFQIVKGKDDKPEGRSVQKQQNLSRQGYKEWQYSPAITTDLRTAQEILDAKKKENRQVNEILKKLGYDYGVVEVKGGTFKMGREGGEDDEKPVHEMTVGDFEMLATEVTEKLYAHVYKEYSSSDLPKTQITTYEAMKFCNKLSEICGFEPAYTITETDSGTNYSCNFFANGFRLPTETEWEYAALGGMYNAEYTVGNPLRITTEKDGWFKDNSSGKTHNVAQKEKNALGLYDMLGNAWEWCWDRYAKDSYKYAYSYGVSTEKNFSVIRGGGKGFQYVSPFYRNCTDPNSKNNDLGFRVVRPTGPNIELSKRKPLSDFNYPTKPSSSSSYSGNSSSSSSSSSSRLTVHSYSTSSSSDFTKFYISPSIRKEFTFDVSTGYTYYVQVYDKFKNSYLDGQTSVYATAFVYDSYGKDVSSKLDLSSGFSTYYFTPSSSGIYKVKLINSSESGYVGVYVYRSSSSSSSSSSYSGSASYSRSSSSSSSSSSSGSFFSNLSTQNRVSDAFGIGYTWIGNDRFSANGVFVNFTSFHKGPLFFDIGDIIMAGGGKKDGYKSGSFFFSMGPRLGLYKGIKRLFLDVHTGAGFYVLSYPEKEKTSSSSSAWDSGYSGYSSSSSEDIDDSAGGFYLKLGAGVEFKLSNYVKATFDYDVYFTFGADPVAADNIRLGICFGQPVYK